MCVLLIEDDHLVRDLVADGLREHGFEVEAAPSGGVAWTSFEADPGRFTALVVDVELPSEETGDHFARRMRSHRPDLALVVTSGRMSALIAAQRANDSRRRALGAGERAAGREDHYLLKPYSIGGLVRTLRRQLNQA